jgi:hypothetical protein
MTDPTGGARTGRNIRNRLDGFNRRAIGGARGIPKYAVRVTG